MHNAHNSCYCFVLFGSLSMHLCQSGFEFGFGDGYSVTYIFFCGCCWVYILVFFVGVWYVRIQKKIANEQENF